MSKTIKVNVDLDDKEAKQKLKDLQEGKYKVDLDVNVDGAKQATQTLNQMGTSGKTTTTVFGKLKNAIADTFSSGKLAMTGYLAILKSIDSAADNAKKTIDEYDNSITDLSVAMNGTREEASQYIQTLNKQAVELKTTTKAASDAADTWLRQGKDVAETETLIRDSLVLSKVGQIESADAADYLTSALNGYKLEAKDAIGVIDKLTAVDAVSASESGGLAVSMSKAASAADMAGVSMDKLVGWIATVKETTRAADEEIGNSLKTMLSRMNQVKAGKFIDEETGGSLNDFEKVLGKIGIALRDANGQFISSEKVLDELGQKFNTLDSVTQRAVATALGGSYQYAKVIALLSNYDKALKYTETAENSAGSAMKKFETSYLDSLEAKQNALQATFESVIMHSDLNKVYGNILDATTALVKFVDETNALKGALTGLTAFAGIKLFMNLKAGAVEAYTELNKLTNAVNIAGQANISTGEFNRLLLLSDGLSKKQMKLVLSTNTLTVAQKKQLLVASGMSEKLATATLQEWKMSAANNGLTASTTSVSNAMKGLWLTLKANPLILITSAITIGASAWQKYKQSVEETNQAASEAASSYKSQSESIENYVSKYHDLREQLFAAKDSEEETKAVKEQLLDLQKQLNEEFGSEYGYLNLVSDAYRDQTEVIKAYNKEAANDFLNKNRKGIQNATEEMTKDRTYYLGSINYSVDENEQEILEKIKSIASANGIQLMDDNSFGFVGGAEEASKAINAFMNELKDLQAQSGATSDSLSSIFDGLLDGSGEELSKADDIITKYQETYQQAQLASIAADDRLSSSYSKVTDAVQKYNEALSSSDDPYNDKAVKDAYDSLQKIKQTVADDSMWDNYRNIIADTFDEADTGAYEIYQTLSKNKDGIGDVANELKGLTETELNAMSNDGDNGDPFDKLVNGAKGFGLTAQDVISVLKKMGIVLGDLGESGQESFAKTKTEMIDAINDMSDGFDVLDKIYADVKNGDVFDFTNLNTKKFEEAFKGLEPEYEKFIETVSASPDDLNKCQDAFNDLATAWIDSKGILEGLTEENANVAQSMLENMGISNAEEIIQQYLGIIKEITDAGYDLENITEEQAVAFLHEAEASDVAKQYLTNYLIQKQLSEQPLNTTADINALANLCDKLGVTGEMYRYVTALKSAFAAVDAGAPIQAYQTQIDSLKGKISDLASKGTVNFKFKYSGGDTSNKKSSSKGSSSSKDTYKEAFEKEYNALKHNLEMEYITEKDYYDGVQALNDKYFKGKEKYLDEYQKYEEEVYKGLKSYYKDYVDKQMNYYEKALDANRITFNMYSSAVKTMLDNMWKSGKLSAEDYWSYVEKLLNKQKDIMDRVLSVITNRIQEEIDKYQAQVDALEAGNDKLEKRKDYLDSARAAAIKALQDEKDAKQAEKDALQDQIDALNDAADAEDLILRKEKALYALRRAEEQRTVKGYVDGHGVVYRQDSDTLQDAKKDLKDIENEEIINKLKKQQDALQETIDKIQENIDWWNDLADLWQDKENDRIATELWGSNYRERILSGDVTITSDFAKEYLAIQDKINDNEQTIESTKEKIEWLDNLKDQYSSVTELYEQERDKQYADQILGAGWEAEVLSGRLTTLDNFKKDYEQLQKDIAKAAWDSAKAQIEAAEAAQKAQAPSSGGGSNNGGGSGGGSGSGSGGSGGGNSGNSGTSTNTGITYKVVSNKSGNCLFSSSSKKDADSFISKGGYTTVGTTQSGTVYVYKVVKREWLGSKYSTSGQAAAQVGMLGGDGYAKNGNYYQVYKEYAKGTTNARKGWNRVGENDPEIIVRNNGDLELAEGEQLAYFQGGETVIPGDETKEILKNQGNVTRLPDGRELLEDGSVKFPDGTMLTPVANPLENLAQPDLAKAMESIQLPHYQQRPMDYGNVTKNENNNNTVMIGDIHLHEVQNVDQFAKEIVMKFPQKVLQEMHRRK